MKPYEIKPTYDNLLQTFINDTISRDNDIFRFVEILNSIDDCCSIALDGNWGSGKTFFVKQVKLVLDAHNENTVSIGEDDRTKVHSAWEQHHNNFSAELQPQVCVYYDAWENDNDEDPVLSLVYSILANVDTDFSFKNGVDCIKIAASILEFFTGKNFGQLIKSFKSDSPLAKLKTNKDIENTVREFLDSLLPEKGNRLVVFIDELDRCKPSYAVKLLERIKHYFSNDRITFVFSINANELQNTIKRYYGENFDACRYLDRFFDLRVSLPPADMRRYYRSLNFNDSHYTVDRVIDAVIRAFHFELREIAKYLHLVRIAVYEATRDSNKFDFSFSDELGVQFGLIYVVPIMIGLKIYDIEQYYNFTQGKDYSPMLIVVDFLNSYSLNRLLASTETYNESNNKTLVTIPDKLKAVYDALFVTNLEGGVYQVSVGQYTFEKGTREKLLKAASLLSYYSNYEM